MCNVTSSSAVNTSITGTGTTTDFNILTVSKGTSQTPILEVNASAFSLSGGASPLVLNNGTFRLSSAQTVTISNGTDFNISATTRLSANGGTLQIIGGNGIDLLLAGTLELLNGVVNVGVAANDNSIEYAATGSPMIIASGGNLNVQAQIRRSVSSSQGGLIYNQSGLSVVSVGINSAASTTRGVFEILNSGSSFTMSGGTLSIARASGSTSIADVYLQPSANSITGGTLEIGTGTTSQTIDINTIVPVYNVMVAGTTNIARLEVNGITLRGSLTITGGNVFQANTFNVNIAGNLTNLNPTATTGVTAGGYQPGSLAQTTNINGSAGNQLITGTAGNLTNFANLFITNSFAAGTVTLTANTNLRVNGTLILSTGTLVDGGNTITAISSVSNSSTHTSAAGGSITLAGTSGQFVGGNGNGKFGNLILNNASGAFFGANQEITQTLTLINGSLVIGTHGLTLSNTSLSTISGANATRFIVTSGLLSDRGVTKAFAGSLSAANFVFPIGVGSKYTPANYTITTGTVGGNVTITPVNSKHPSATGPGTAYISYYWSISHTITNLLALTHTYTYVVSDESGVTTDYRDARFNGGAWTIGLAAGNPNITTRVITFTNFTNLNGDYTAGEATAFVNPTTYTSIASGSWESDALVWSPDPPGIGFGPPAGSFVIVSVGHTITVTSSAHQVATLSVRGRLHLGSTTGHDFGTVTTIGGGDRTIQIQTSTFPIGDFTTFNATGGGTVEYNGALTLPTQATYNNLTFTGVGAKILSSTDLTINGNLTVSTGTVNNAVSNKNITLTSVTGDFTNSGTFLTGDGAIVVGRDFTNQGASATFIGGGGSGGLRVAGNFVNSTNATFALGTDSLGVRGTLTNSATFTGAAGAIRVSGSLNNMGGTFTTGSGILSVTGSLTNNSTYSAGAGVTTIGGSLTNSGAAAVFNANANAMTFSGNFTNSTSGTFNAGSGTIAAGGNWNQSATFNAGTGAVTFASASAHSLTGTTTFNNLTKSNGGALTLNSDITVVGLLTMTSGNITTGSNVVNLTNTATQPSSGSASSFIDGRLAISYPNTAGGNRVYHVGKTGIYRPVTIQQNAASTSPIVRVEMIEVPPSGSFPSSLESLSTIRHYAVNLVSGIMNSPTVQLSFNTNSPADETVTVPGNVHIVKSTVASTGPWTDEGGSGVFSPAAPAGYAISGTTSIAASTFFAIAYENQVLPIELKSFAATLKDGAVNLDWVTVSEINNAWFTIERSKDGIHFDSLLSIEGAGNSNQIKRYHEKDKNPLTGRSYYRLKQTDYDGRHDYSDIVVVYNTNTVKTSITVYPNPAKSSEDFFVKVNGTQSRDVYVVVTHVSGRIVYSGYATLNEDFRINIQKLSSVYRFEPGAYIITLRTTDFQDIKKLIIEE